MKKNNLYTLKRYPLIVALFLLLAVLGGALEKSWHMTPWKHFDKGVSELKDNPDKALSHFIQANKTKDNALKMFTSYHLARLYHLGGKNLKTNIEKAVFYYEQSASLGMPKAQYQLALLYNTGDKIPENRQRAISYMIEAAKILPEAKYALAVWIEQGYFGKPNQEEAILLYEQAADAGIQDAIKSLIAIYHIDKEQTPENIKRAKYWRERLEKESKKK